MQFFLLKKYINYIDSVENASKWQLFVKNSIRASAIFGTEEISRFLSALLNPLVFIDRL